MARGFFEVDGVASTLPTTPWSIDELNDVCFVVMDSSGRTLRPRATTQGIY